MNAILIMKVIHYNQFACIQLNETINHMLGHGIELKSFHVNTDSNWKNSDGRYNIRILDESQRKNKISDKTQKCVSKHQSLLMRLWSNRFQHYNMITLSSLSLQLFTVTMAHEEQCSKRFTLPFALEYKQSEHGNILCPKTQRLSISKK